MMSYRVVVIGCVLLVTAGARCWPHGEPPARAYVEPPAEASTSKLVQVSFREGSERLTGAEVSPEFFSTAQAQPLLGRVFVRDDFTAGAMVVLHHDLWQRAFNRDPAIIGTAIVVDGRPATVVGIMPRGFNFPTGAQIWMPRRK